MTFFSGTDERTLQEEGNERNCFVSLIVNNKGEYCARVTRKLQCKSKVTIQTLGTTYEFFGEGERQLAAGTDPIEQIKEETVIQYFDLEVERHEVTKLEFLDRRFEEIEAQKKKNMPDKSSNSSFEGSFRDWLNAEKDVENPKIKQPTLFSKKEIKEIIDYSKWMPDPTIIHRMVINMVTCSFIANDSIDLKQWITRHMEKKYDEIFFEDNMFTEWKDFIIEYLISNYSTQMDIPGDLIDEYDTWQSRIAEAMLDELGDYPVNDYLQQYIDQLILYVNYE